MATKITNPSVPEEQVSNAEDVQKTSASEAPAAELVTVAVPAEDPAGEPVAAAVGETAAEPPVEAAAPAEEPGGAAPVEEPETAVPAVASAGEAVAAPAEGVDFADEEAALAARSAGLDEEEPADGEAVDEGAAGASDALFAGRSEEEMVSLFAKMLDEEPVQSLRRVVEAVKIAFYKAHRAEVEAQRRAFVEAGGDEAEFVPAADAQELRLKDLFKEYRRRRDMVVSWLNKIEGFAAITPAGAFYAFPRISSLGMDGFKFCSWLLEEAGVSTVPGEVFGMPGRIRLAYCRGYDYIEEGTKRIKDAVVGLRG